MLEVVHGGDVVPVFVEVDCRVKVDPSARLVVRVDLIDLHLPRADPGEGVIVVTECESSCDLQLARGASGKACYQSLLVNLRDVPRGVIARRGTAKSQRNKLAGRGIHRLGTGRRHHAVSARSEEIVRSGSGGPAREKGFSRIERSVEIGNRASRVIIADAAGSHGREVGLELEGGGSGVLSEKTVRRPVDHVGGGTRTLTRARGRRGRAGGT